MLRHTLTIFILFAIGPAGYGQDVLEFVRNNPRLTIQHNDNRLDSLLAKQSRIDHAEPTIHGFRVQIYSGSGNDARDNANRMRSEFLQLYPDIAAHLIFQQPNFKVRIGDLRSELEAIRMKKEIGFDYPHGFVVRDMIDLPTIQFDEGEEEMKDMDVPE